MQSAKVLISGNSTPATSSAYLRASATATLNEAEEPKPPPIGSSEFTNIVTLSLTLR